MYSSLSWIEWLDRLDRVLGGAREDVAALSRAVGPRSLAPIERSKRQLSALIHDLRLLNRNVLSVDATASTADLADNLQRALDTTVFHMASLAQVPAAGPTAIRKRELAAIAAALRDSSYEAAVLLEPRRRRA